MVAIRVHQLLHGYRHGHELLAGSIRLSAPDSDLVTRLSDLSGSLGSDQKFVSYLTAYPLPSGKFYALATTWPDESAPRAGCVLTHTLLIPSTQWIHLHHPEIARRLFRAPKDTELTGYETDLELKDEMAPIARKDSIERPSLSTEFVSRYFGEGIKPVVWFGDPNPDMLAWSIIRSLWPKLRYQFACCTLSLQPRSLDERPFDVLFAPSAVYSRFAKFSADHILDTSASGRKSASSASDPWCDEWARVIFSMSGPDNALGALSPLWCELNEDPTSIRRIYLVQEMRERAKESPMAAIGVMDVVESLAMGTNDALELKRGVIKDAIEVAQKVSLTEDSVGCLRLVDDRLRRPAFASAAADVSGLLAEAVATDVSKSPELVLRAGESIFSRDVDNIPSPFVAGILVGLDRLANRDPSQLLVLRKVSNIAPAIIGNRPELATAYLQAIRQNPVDAGAQKDLLTWVASLHQPDVLHALRVALLPLLGQSEDVELISELLQDIPETDLAFSLDALAGTTSDFRSEAIRQVVEKQLVSTHRQRVRKWAATSATWSTGIAMMAAASYPTNRGGLEELLTDQEFSPEKKPATIAMYLRFVGQRWLPDWLRSYASESPDLLFQLLAAGPPTAEDVTYEIGRLLQEVRTIPLARAEGLATKLDAFGQMPFFDSLVDTAMKSAISGRIQGWLSSKSSEVWHSQSFALDWLGRISAREIEGLVSQYSFKTGDNWLRTWEWLAAAPRPLYERTSFALHSIVYSLLPDSRAVWLAAVSEYWVVVLRRSRSLAPHREHLALCVQALRYAFTNTHYPLGAVVAETFGDIYSAVTTQPYAPPETAALFGIFDWDKGKELRRSLVEAFMNSQWPPGDLALAAREPSLLRKIVKRVLRQRGGQRYAQSMLADLARNSEVEAKNLHQVLQELVRDPDFYEEWD